MWIVVTYLHSASKNAPEEIIRLYFHLILFDLPFRNWC